jgi:two-component system chemotaxis sensor kinase CheA
MTRIAVDIPDDLRGVFLEEVEERLAVLDQGVLRLEHDTSAALLAELLRATHTLKASFATVGLHPMTDVTHAIEDVLLHLQAGALAMSPPVIDAILHGLDLLRTTAAVLADADTLATLPARAKRCIKSLRATGVVPVHEEPVDHETPLEALPPGQVALLVCMDDDCQMPGVRADMVLRALTALGTLVDCRPSRRIIHSDLMGHRLLAVLQSEVAAHALRRAVLSVSEVAWVRIAHGVDAAGMYLTTPARPRGEDPAPAETALPTATLRVPMTALDELLALVDRLHDWQQAADGAALAAGLTELQARLTVLREQPAGVLLQRFPRLVRDLCRITGKEVDLHLDGETVPLARPLIERLLDPLLHLLRNAVDHGIETPERREAAGKPRVGTVHLAVARTPDAIRIRVTDDGAGMQPDRLRARAVDAGLLSPGEAAALSDVDTHSLIFRPGFSTALQVNTISGRGIGMDVVRTQVSALGGEITVASVPGQGTTFTLCLPAHLPAETTALPA